MSALLGLAVDAIVLGAVVDATEEVAVGARRREQRARAVGQATEPYAVAPERQHRKRRGPGTMPLLDGW